MKLSALFSDEQISALKAAAREYTITDALNALCDKCEIQASKHAKKRAESAKSSGENVLIFVGKGGINFMPVRERSLLLAKSVKLQYKRGGVLWLHDGEFTTVTETNFGWVEYMFSPVPEYVQAELDRPGKYELREIRDRRSREKMFDEARSVDSYKKMGKRGFNMTFDELKHRRIVQEYDRQLYRTERVARNIVSAM